MGKQTWKAGNMIYPLPAVMVSCVRRVKTEYYYSGMDGYGMYESSYGLYIGETGAVFLRYHPGNG